MIFPIFFTSRIRAFLRKNLARLAIFLIAVVTYGTVSEYLLERNAVESGVKSPFDALWFVMQTITTVGYGDTPVVTFWGRINAIALMLVGIGILGFFSASFATILIDYSTRRRLGEHKLSLKDHIVICNWNPIAEELAKEIVRENPKSVILLAQVERNPSDELEFVKGTSLHVADLQRANVMRAASVIILSESISEGELASAVDAKTILGIMNVRKLSKDVHIVAELLKQDSQENARSAGADELVIRGEVSAKLLSRAAMYPGTIDVVETILTSKSGEEIFETKLPLWAVGKTWIEIAKFFLEKNATPIALRRANGLKINPSSSMAIGQEDSVVYISNSKVDTS